MTYYKEFASTVKARAGTMVTLETLDKLIKTLKDTGYSSVYCFKEEDALDIKQRGSSSGMSDHIVGTDVVIIDLDQGDDQLVKAESKLKALNIGYDIYKSPSKGFHIYIPMTEFIWSFDLPYSQQLFVDSLKIEADLSLYQAGRLISNVGRISPKTKGRKTFLYTVEGNKLDLKIIEKPKMLFDFAPVSVEGRLQLGILGLGDLVQFPPPQGNRHIRLYSISKDLIIGGLASETVLDLMQVINRTWPNPKTDGEVLEAVKGANITLRKVSNDR